MIKLGGRAMDQVRSCHLIQQVGMKASVDMTYDGQGRVCENVFCVPMSFTAAGGLAFMALEHAGLLQFRRCVGTGETVISCHPAQRKYGSLCEYAAVAAGHAGEPDVYLLATGSGCQGVVRVEDALEMYRRSVAAKAEVSTAGGGKVVVKSPLSASAVRFEPGEPGEDFVDLDLVAGCQPTPVTFTLGKG